MKINFVGEKIEPELKTIIKNAVKQTLKELGQSDRSLELNIAFYGEEDMKNLNLRTRNIDKVTDVLSYPNFALKPYETLSLAQKEEGFLGDMAICLPYAEKNAKEYRVSLYSEVEKLVVHSVLHLMGFDHIADEDYKIMHKEEQKILAKLKKEKMFRSGFIAVIGKPNVGKSTLINALVGEKVAITSPKPQTTRNKILGIKNGEDYQIVFVDTPGIVNGQSELSKYLKKSTESAVKDVDAIVVLLDAGKVTKLDYDLIAKQEKSSAPVFVVVNKVDISSYEKLYPVLAKLNEYKFVKKFVTLSALRKKNIDVLVDSLLEILPEGPAYFPTDQITDKNLRFMAGEIIREKALLFLQEEIPHGIAVDITQYKELKSVVKINADIICESDRHKQIIIGAKGSMLKRIGSSSRAEIEKLTSIPVMLELFVKVKPGWKQSRSDLADLGYDIKEI